MTSRATVADLHSAATIATFKHAQIDVNELTDRLLAGLN